MVNSTTGYHTYWSQNTRAISLFRNGPAKSTLTFLQGPLGNSVIRRGPLALQTVVAWQLRHSSTFLPLHQFQGTTREHGATALYAKFLDGLRGQTLPFFLEVPVVQRYVPLAGRVRQLQQASLESRLVFVTLRPFPLSPTVSSLLIALGKLFSITKFV